MMKIQTFLIKVNDGRREVSQEAVNEMADSISKVGLLNPITVDQDSTLIAGLHRLEAAKLLGWTEIECNVSGLEGLMAELAEIDENLIRQKFDQVEEWDQLARRKEIYELLYPETRRGKRNGQTSKTDTVNCPRQVDKEIIKRKFTMWHQIAGESKPPATLDKLLRQCCVDNPDGEELRNSLLCHCVGFDRIALPKNLVKGKSLRDGYPVPSGSESRNSPCEWYPKQVMQGVVMPP